MAHELLFEFLNTNNCKSQILKIKSKNVFLRKVWRQILRIFFSFKIHVNFKPELLIGKQRISHFIKCTVGAIFFFPKDIIIENYCSQENSVGNNYNFFFFFNSHFETSYTELTYTVLYKISLLANKNFTIMFFKTTIAFLVLKKANNKNCNLF